MSKISALQRTYNKKPGFPLAHLIHQGHNVVLRCDGRWLEKGLNHWRMVRTPEPDYIAAGYEPLPDVFINAQGRLVDERGIPSSAVFHGNQYGYPCPNCSRYVRFTTDPAVAYGDEYLTPSLHTCG